MRITYQAVKAADPVATTVLGAIYRGYDIVKIAHIFEALRDLPGAAPNGYYHDAIGYHLYDGGHCTQFDEIGFLERDYFTPNVGRKPIWLTESGIRVRAGGGPEYATPAESASFLLTNYAYALHKNVARYYYFRAIDERAITQPADDDIAWGLLDAGFNPRPSYGAFRTAAQFLPQTFEWSVRKFGNRFEEALPAGPVARITYYNTPLGRVSMLYNITNMQQTYTFTSVLPAAIFVRPDGASETRAPGTSGQYVLALPAAPNFRWSAPECQVAGDPLIIIEGDTTPPTVSFDALPTSATSGITLTWRSADDGPAAAAGVWWHELEAQRDGGAWQVINSEAYGSALRFAAPFDGRYSFRIRARDRAGNLSAPALSDVVTMTGTVPPTPTFVVTRRVFMPLLRRS